MKTLNDFILSLEIVGGRYLHDEISATDLRQSAIDDIKKLKKKHNKLPAVNQSDEDCYKTGETEGKINYIKKKFNIKDKDLK